ncbi:MAG: hypothetical protein M0D57_15590 [Sphingobacteriales bacterium JAD_PAG50586_3]|nr:MAG: hypothetical protein M0D57_15590 [Sphingobacteriales bacterium JAD_PAG50586_3]
MEVLVFKTSVDTEQHIEQLAPVLNSLIQPPSWNFDLEDVDRILRVESDQDIANNLVLALTEKGFLCVELA